MSGKYLNNSKQKRKIDFKKLKKNTFNSLGEVEIFLNNIKDVSKYLKLYKLLK